MLSSYDAGTSTRCRLGRSRRLLHTILIKRSLLGFSEGEQLLECRISSCFDVTPSSTRGWKGMKSDAGISFFFAPFLPLLRTTSERTRRSGASSLHNCWRHAFVRVSQPNFSRVRFWFPLEQTLQWCGTYQSFFFTAFGMLRRVSGSYCASFGCKSLQIRVMLVEALKAAHELRFCTVMRKCWPLT